MLSFNSENSVSRASIAQSEVGAAADGGCADGPAVGQLRSCIRQVPSTTPPTARTKRIHFAEGTKLDGPHLISLFLNRLFHTYFVKHQRVSPQMVYEITMQICDDHNCAEYLIRQAYDLIRNVEIRLLTTCVGPDGTVIKRSVPLLPSGGSLYKIGQEHIMHLRSLGMVVYDSILTFQSMRCTPADAPTPADDGDTVME